MWGTVAKGKRQEIWWLGSQIFGTSEKTLLLKWHWRFKDGKMSYVKIFFFMTEKSF